MQLTHYVQLLSSGKFRQYDYRWENVDHYNSSKPSKYALENVTAPTYLYHATEDLLISKIVRISFFIETFISK